MGRAIFVGLPLPPAAREAVAALVDRVQAAMTLRSSGAAAGAVRRPVRWVRMDGIHVTVRFLGPTPPESIAGVERALSVAAGGTSPFRLHVHGAGGFPRADRPRTLWLQIDEGEADAADFARRLDHELEREGWAREARPFRAHLTLARSDGVREGPETLRRLMSEAQGLSVEWVADEAVLFESVTGGGPARYEPLLRVPFPGDPGR